MSDTRAAAHDPTAFYNTDLTALPLADRGSLPQPTLSEIWKASDTVTRADQPNASQDRQYQAWEPVIDALNANRPWLKRFHNPGAGGANFDVMVTDENGSPVLSSPGAEELEQRAWLGVQQARRADPHAFADLPGTLDEFRAKFVPQEKARLNSARNVLDRNEGVIGGLTSLGSSVVSGFRDPLNVASMAFGGGEATIARRVIGAALGNAAMEAIEQPFVARERGKIGEKLTLGEAAANVGSALAGGALLQGAGEVLAPGASRLANLARSRLGWGNMTPAEQAATHVLDRETEVAASSPFTPGVGTEEHVARLDRTRAALDDPPPAPPPPGTITATPRAAPSADALTPDRIIQFVMHDLEGGSKVVHFSEADGGTTKYGIAARANPGVDVANLSESDAAAIARRKYWFRELDGADPRAAAVAFDAGYISGPETGRRILRESGGDPQRALDLYREHLNHLADTVPGKAKFREGWYNRVNKLAKLVDEAPDSGPSLRRDMFADDEEHIAAQQALDEEEQAAARAERAQAEFDRGGDPGTLDNNDGPATVDGLPAGIIRASEGEFVRPSNAPSEAAAESEAVPTPEGMVADSSPLPAGSNLSGADLQRDVQSTQIAAIEGQRGPAQRAPVELKRFLAQHGGIRDDEGHDLAKGRGLQQLVPGSGALIRKAGMPLDRARELAAEAGYFHHLGPDDAMANTTTADFLDMLEGAQHEPRYTLRDLPEVYERELQRSYRLDQEERRARE